MPNERYLYRGLKTDLGKILSIWPFENSTTAFLVHKVKSKIWLENKKISYRQKNSLYPLCIIKFLFLAILSTFQNIQFLTTVLKIDRCKTWFDRPKMKILLCKGGIRKTFAFIKIFNFLVKFWTLLYGPKPQRSNSQKAKLIGFF